MTRIDTEPYHGSLNSIMSKVKGATGANSLGEAYSVLMSFSPEERLALGVSDTILRHIRDSGPSIDMSYRQVVPTGSRLNGGGSVGGRFGTSGNVFGGTPSRAGGGGLYASQGRPAASVGGSFASPTDDRGSDPAFNNARLPIPGNGSAGTFRDFNANPPPPTSGAGIFRDFNHDPVPTPAVGMVPDGNDRGSDPNRGGMIPPTPPVAQAPADNTIPTITHMPDENLPNIPHVTLSWHDFTELAKQKVAGAYQPLYDAINLQRTNNAAQEANSSKIVGGMYANLDKQNTADNAATGARYDTARNNAAASNTALQNMAKGASSSANNELASVLANAGLGNAQGTQGNGAAEILADTVGKGSAATLDAQTAGANNLASIDAQKNIAMDYGTATGSADRAQGAVAQQDLLNQLVSANNYSDQQTLETKGQAAQQGLTLAQQMSQNDWTAQQGSADQTWNAYNAAMGQYSAKTSNDLANINLQNQAAQAQRDAQVQYAAAAERVREFEITSGQNQAAQEDLNKYRQAELEAKALVDQRTAELNQLQAGISQQNANSASQNADSNSISAQANAARVNPSPAYLAQHLPSAEFRKTLLGITGDPNKALSLESYATQKYAQMSSSTLAARFAGNPGLAQSYYRDQMIKGAVAAGFTEAQASAAADAFQALNSGSPTVVPPTQSMQPNY